MIELKMCFAVNWIYVFVEIDVSDRKQTEF